MESKLLSAPSSSLPYDNLAALERRQNYHSTYVIAEENLYVSDIASSSCLQVVCTDLDKLV